MKKDIQKASSLLKDGHVVAIPTETVYGLAANAFDEKAVKKIFEVKQRPTFNPLIVHIKSIDDIEKVAIDIPEKAMILAKQFWPGALTLVLPKKNVVPNIVTSGKNTVGVRIPSHSVALDLLNELDFPLAAPSANPFGYISPTTTAHVKKQLGNKIPFILDGGNCEKGIESTIVGFENKEAVLYRVGAISKEEIEKHIGEIKSKTNAAAKPEAPGMLSKHYSPKTKFLVSDNIQYEIEKYKNQNIAFMLFSKINSDNSDNIYFLSRSENLDEAARNLYALMHELDGKRFDLIIAEKFPQKGLGISLNDRLYRAQEEEFDFKNTLINNNTNIT